MKMVGFQCVVLCGLLSLLASVTAFPTDCKDDKYYDQDKQTYLPCTDCKEEKSIECNRCCPSTKPESIRSSMSKPTRARVSRDETSAKTEYRILSIFLHSFVVLLVVFSLLVLVFVAYKVARERQEAQCNQGNHFQNADVRIIQEVFASTTAGQDGILEGTSHQTDPKTRPLSQVNITVNQLPETVDKQSGFERSTL